MALKTVFVDTAPFIYLFEDNLAYAGKVEALFKEWKKEGVKILTSTITLMEVLTQPLRCGATEIALRYNSYFTNENEITLLSIGPNEAFAAANFRAKYGLKTPDSLQLAAALCGGAEVVLTNDRQWKQVKELSMRLLDEDMLAGELRREQGAL